MFIMYPINMYIMPMPLIFVKLLTHEVPRIWGSCELRITDSRRFSASSSIKCHAISIIPFLLWSKTSCCSSQSKVPTFWPLSCIVWLRWTACFSVSVNPETLKNIKLTLLYNKTKRTCVISSRVRVVLHVVPNLWKKSHLLGPSSLGPDRVTIKLVVFPGHQNATFKNFHRSHQNLPTESSWTSSGFNKNPSG